MKKFYSEFIIKILTISVIVIAAMNFYGCSEDPTPNLYERVGPAGDPAVITTLDPPNEALAGVTEVTINGSNFSTVPENNYVYFNEARAEVLQATATQLIVVAPPVDIPVDSTNGVKYGVKIWVFNLDNPVELYSNTYDYTLKYAVSEHYKFADTDQPWGITTDLTENIYVSAQSSIPPNKGIFKLTPAKDYTRYAQFSQTFWPRIRYGADGKIYGIYNGTTSAAIFVVNNEGANPAVFVGGAPLRSLFGFDFDQNLNIWTAGLNNTIYRIKPDKDIKQIPFNVEVKDVRVFNGYLYLSGKQGTTIGIWRKQIISDDSLGTDELYFDFSAKYGTKPIYGTELTLNSITFAADGDMYVGTNMQNDAVVVVHPDGSDAIFYPGLLPRPVYDFAWGPGQVLYYSSIETLNAAGETALPFSLVRIDMRKQGAPYYGRD